MYNKFILEYGFLGEYMEYGINIRYFSRLWGMEKAAELVAKNGFKYVDYTPPLLDDNREKIMKEDKKIFDEYGIKVHQTHAPFNRYGTFGDKFLDCMEKVMEATEFLKAKYIAVHGDEFDFENFEFTPERAFDYNHNLFSPYVKRAEKKGFKLAFETVFEDGCRGRRYTSDSEELKNLILSFNSQNAVCCWDFGHANVSFKHLHAQKINEFGSLIQCTHVHDNAGNDSHQMPMTGDIKWEEVIPALKSTGFNGVMSIEYAHGKPTAQMAEDFVRLTKTAVEYISNL